MKEHSPKNVSPIAENLSQAGGGIDELFPTTKQEKDRAMFEHEAFHTNKKPSADEMHWDSKVKISSNIANAGAIDDLMKAADLDSDLLSNKTELKNRSNSYKR